MSLQVTIPIDLSDITIAQWQAAMKLEKTRETMNQMQYVIEIIKLFTDEADRNRLAYVQSGTLLRVYNRIKEAFTKRSDTEQMLTTFELGGELYGLNPNLSAVTSIEYAEAIEVAKQGDDQLHNLMQVFIRKVTDTNSKGEYIVEPYAYSEDRAKLIQNEMDMDKVLRVQAFFLTISTIYTNETKQCSDQFPEEKYTQN